MDWFNCRDDKRKQETKIKFTRKTELFLLSCLLLCSNFVTLKELNSLVLLEKCSVKGWGIKSKYSEKLIDYLRHMFQFISRFPCELIITISSFIGFNLSLWVLPPLITNHTLHPITDSVPSDEVRVNYTWS